VIEKKLKAITYNDLMREFEAQYPGRAERFRPHGELPFSLFVWLKSGEMILVQYHTVMGIFIKLGEKLVIPG